MLFYNGNHSSDNMKYKLYLPFLYKNEYIIFCDIDKNSAFREFVKDHNLNSFVQWQIAGTIFSNYFASIISLNIEY